MEIKVGDKVRVREDAPKILRKIIPSKVFDEESKVVAIDSEMAVVWTEPIHKNLIPLKYLIKVDAEAKEAKYRIGDRVRVKGCGYEPNLHKGDIGEILDINDKEQCFVLFKKSQAWIYADCLEPYTEPTAAKFKVGDRVKFKNIYELQKVKDKSFRWMLVMFASKEATITAVEDNGFYRVDIDPSIGGINDDMIECKVEPTEQTEAEESFEDQLRDVFNGVEHQDYGRPIQTAMINLDINDWDSYAAELAKEIAVKVANKYNDPKEAADYAVKVAKAVVEGLKRK